MPLTPTTAVGSTSRTACGLSSDVDLGAYVGRLRSPAGVFPQATSEDASDPRIELRNLYEFSGANGSIAMAACIEGELTFGFLPAVAAFVGIGAGRSQRVLEIRVPLGPSAAPGEYPLEFESGEFVPLEPGPSIVPRLMGGTLDVIAVSRFIRGDCNGDGSVDISDAVSMLGSLFLGEGEPGCGDACDSNDDGAVDISDAIATLGVLFLGNGVVPRPGMKECGVDPTGDTVDCETFSKCP